MRWRGWVAIVGSVVLFVVLMQFWKFVLSSNYGQVVKTKPSVPPPAKTPGKELFDAYRANLAAAAGTESSPPPPTAALVELSSQVSAPSVVATVPNSRLSRLQSKEDGSNPPQAWDSADGWVFRKYGAALKGNQTPVNE